MNDSKRGAGKASPAGPGRPSGAENRPVALGAPAGGCRVVPPRHQFSITVSCGGQAGIRAWSWRGCGMVNRLFTEARPRASETPTTANSRVMNGLASLTRSATRMS